MKPFFRYFFTLIKTLGFYKSIAQFSVFRNRWNRLLALAIAVAYLVVFFGYQPRTLSQLVGDAFDCDGTLYISQSTQQSPNTQLNFLNTNTFGLGTIGGTTAGEEYNGMGFNVQDGLIYGIDPDSREVQRVNRNGTIETLGRPAGLPATAQFFAGDFDDAGNYIVYDVTRGRLYKLNVQNTPPTVIGSAITLSGDFTPNLAQPFPNNDFADLAFNPVDGNLYGINTGNRELARINPNTGDVDYIAEAPEGQPFGAVFFDAFGRLFAYDNGGILYRVNNVNTNPGSFLPPLNDDIESVTRNDGAGCPYSPVIEKTVSPETITAGGTVTYTYRIVNRTRLDINDVTFSDRLPPDTTEPLDGRTFLSIESNPLGGEVSGLDTGTLTITGITIPARTDTNITVEVQIPTVLNPPAPGTFFNQATVDGTVGDGGIPSRGKSDFPMTPSFPDPTPLQINPGQVELVADKTVEPVDNNGNGKTEPGEDLLYKVIIRNTGTANSTNTIFRETIPENTTYVPGSTTLNENAVADVDGNIPFAGNGNLVNSPGEQNGMIAPGESATIEFRVRINNPLPPGVTQILNQATVKSEQTNEIKTRNPDTPNDPDSPTIIPIIPSADLGVIKTAEPSTPNVGDQVTFTIELTNNGPNTATGVEILEELPDGFTFVSDNPSQGTYDSNSRIWTVGTLETGQIETLEFVATYDVNERLVNTVKVNKLDQSDPNPSNDQDSLVVPEEFADLAVTKTSDPAKPTVGQTFSYIIELKNLGPDTATNVTVTEQLPVGVTYQSNQPSVGTFDNQTGIWSVPTLAQNGTATLEIVATLDTPNIVTNSAEVSGSDQTDNNPDNDRDTYEIEGSTSGGETSPRLRLVKRITSITRSDRPIPGVNFNRFFDDPNDENDNVFPANQRPVGITQLESGESLESGDEVQYTIYFLSDGNQPVTNVRVCDPIPEGTSFIPNSFGSGQGILVNQGGEDTTQTNRGDGDQGRFFSPLAPLNNVNPPCPNPQEPKGAVFVELGDVPTTEPNNVGFVRFWVKVD